MRFVNRSARAVVAQFGFGVRLLSRIASGYASGMKRSPMPRDPNERAKAVVDFATGQRTPESAPVKDPAAIARGHLGGIKGGAARAAKMTAAERSASASKAAKARWEQARQA
jgi:hypothetical protein